MIGPTPRSGATGVDRDLTLRIRFGEPGRGVSATTVRLVNLRTGLTVRTKVRRYDATSRTLILDPYYRMAAWTRYRVIIRSGIRDMSGNTLPAQTRTFRTGRS